MKSKPAHTLFALWLALALAILPALRAQETPAPPAPVQPTAPTDKSVDQPKPDETKVATEAEKAEEPKAAAEAEKAAANEPAEPAADADKNVTAESAEKTTPVPAETTAPGENKSKHRRVHISHHSNNERVSIFHDSTLAAGEQADAVVSIFGSSTSAGEVADAVVSVIGSSTSSGNAGGAVVSVIGNTRVEGGTVGDVAVAVLGNTYVNGHVKGEVVAVLGNIELGPNAVVDGEMVCVGGEVIRDAKAIVHGNVQHIAVGGHYMNFSGLNAWFTQCLLYARPLAFDSRLLWAWCIGFAFLGFYALIALVAPAGVTKCVETLEQRPGKSILAGVLALLLTPVAYLLLFLTIFIGIGFVLLPLFSMGLFFASIFGKVVMLAWFGRRLTKFFGDSPLAHPVFAVLIGGLIVLLLYTVPILGFVVYKLMGVLGLGVVVYTLLLSLKSSREAAAAARTAAAAAKAKAQADAAAAASAAMPPVMGEAAGAPVTPLAASLPPVISAMTLPRAGFWIRFMASVLDAVMVGIVFGMMHRMWNGFGGVYPFWYAVYCVIMWATKGTTIGGIICGLKVVRVDDRPVDWSVAIVRGLSAFLSLAMAGLGFIWVAFDDERQSWHDKIAGTTIVKVPRGTPLI